MMQLPDVLPSGQTGWDLTLEQRINVRRYYRMIRQGVWDKRLAKKFTVKFVVSSYPEAIYV